MPVKGESENLLFEEIAAQEEQKQEETKIIRQKKIKKSEIRKMPVPFHRMSPLKKQWAQIVELLVKKLKLQVRMNVRRRQVEIKRSDLCEELLNLNRASDFIKAFCLGFDLNDALALLRLDDLYIESFEIKDVKRLKGDNLSRCIARITGDKGKTKIAIENATKTRIVVASSKIHILGSFNNIKMSRNAICQLILGSPATKVYSQLRYVCKRKLEF